MSTATETKSYRGRHEFEGLMSRDGYAMFADDMESILHYASRNGRIYSVGHSRLTPIGDLADAIALAWSDEDERPYGFGHIEVGDVLAAFDPADIVNSAEAYDAPKMVQWLWDRVLEAREILGLKTQDGAIVFDPSIVDQIA